SRYSVPPALALPGHRQLSVEDVTSLPPPRRLVTHPLQQIRYGVCANSLDSRRGSDVGHPVTQLFSTILGLLFVRPERDHTNSRQDTRCQYDDDPSSAHGLTLSKCSQSGNLSALRWDVLPEACHQKSRLPANSGPAKSPA